MMTSVPVVALSAAIALILSAAGTEAKGLVKGGDFSSGKDAFWSTPNVRLSLRSGQLCGDVAAGTANAWDALIGVDTLAIKAGKPYSLTFEARATGNGAPDTVKAVLQDPTTPWTARFSAAVDVVEAMQPFNLPFASDHDGKAQLVFHLGGKPTSWRFCIDNVAIVADKGGNVDSVSKPQPVASQAKAKPILTPVDDPVRLNQFGYAVDGPKRATIISVSKVPIKFRLKDATGQVLGEGETEPHGFDPASGYGVHIADFTALTIPGNGYRLETDDGQSYGFTIGGDLYRRLAVDSLSWFYLQRSGIAIDGAIAGAAYARPAGHIGVAPNEGDVSVGCLTGAMADKLYGPGWQCTAPRDVSGGWYDAGDHGKYVVNGGISVAQIMAAFERAKTFAKDSPLLADGYARLPERGNGVPDILDEARWELEFLLKMIVPEGQPLAGMAYHKVHDVKWTGLPMLPHLDPQARALHRPSTAAALNVAAVAAQGARLFRPYDPAFADQLLQVARTSYAAAAKHPALKAPVSDGQQGGGDYDDTDVSDEFFWAAAELFITTGESGFLDAMHASPHWRDDPFDGSGFDWRSVAAFARLELGLFADALPESDRKVIRDSISTAADRLLALQKKQAFGYVYKPKDGVFAWGSNHLTLQNLLVLAAAYDLGGGQDKLAGVREGMDYVLGRNPMNMSYVTGYGSAYSRNQHSRWYAHQIDKTLPEPPIGSLAGGPNATLVDPVARKQLADCAGSRCYIDDIGSWGTNEITINWNAALVEIASFLADAK